MLPCKASLRVLLKRFRLYIYVDLTCFWACQSLDMLRCLTGRAWQHLAMPANKLLWWCAKLADVCNLQHIKGPVPTSTYPQHSRPCSEQRWF